MQDPGRLDADTRDHSSERRLERRFWIRMIILALALAYLIAFVAENTQHVSVHWVFWTTHSSLIWVIVVSLALGLIVGVLLPPLHRRRRRRRLKRADAAKRGGEPLDSGRDLPG